MLSVDIVDQTETRKIVAKRQQVSSIPFFTDNEEICSHLQNHVQTTKHQIWGIMKTRRDKISKEAK